ncbi:MAG: ABC transporter substrate-binding protein [Rhodothermales bacterium]
MRFSLSRMLIALVLVMLAIPGSELWGQTQTGSYGNTPDEMRPYRRFQEPYALFFDKPQPFLGTGREKSPPPDLKLVKIGFLGPLEDSPEAALGRHMLQGATLAIEEANAQGGYQGLPFELVLRDDAGPWGASSNKFVELSDEKVWAVLGSIDGASTHIALRVALKLELPMVTTGSTDPTLTETRIPWLVRVNADDRQNGYALASYIYQEKGYRRVAALRANNRYGRKGITEFKDAARRLGAPLLFELRYAPGDTIFTTQLMRINKSSAEAVVLWADAEEAAHIVQQMREMGMQHAVFGTDRLVSPDFLTSAGPAAEGVIATYPYNPEQDDPYVQDFNRRYAQRFGEEPEAFAAHAFDGMNMIIQAIHTAGLNRARIRDVLSAVKGFQGVTGQIVLDATHNDVGPVWLVEIRDGAFHFFPSLQEP